MMPQHSSLQKARLLLLHMVPAHQLTVLIQGLSWASVLVGILDWHEGLAILGGNFAALITLVLCPRCQLLGPNHTRLSVRDAARGAIALTFDDGPDPVVTPQVLDILDRYGARASFFCVGKAAAAYPQIVRDIAQRGHRVENHSYAHGATFAALSTPALTAEIQNAQTALSNAGVPLPRYFRAPMGFRSPLLANVLRRLGMKHVAWTRRGYDRILRDPHQVCRRLTTGLTAGDILLLHDKSGQDGATPVVLTALPLVLDYVAANGLQAIALPPDLGETAALCEQQSHIHG